MLCCAVQCCAVLCNAMQCSAHLKIGSIIARATHQLRPHRITSQQTLTALTLVILFVALILLCVIGTGIQDLFWIIASAMVKHIRIHQTTFDLTPTSVCVRACVAANKRSERGTHSIVISACGVCVCVCVCVCVFGLCLPYALHSSLMTADGRCLGVECCTAKCAVFHPKQTKIDVWTYRLQHPSISSSEQSRERCSAAEGRAYFDFRCKCDVCGAAIQL